MKGNKGITLIALIVTIVILIILAMVAIKEVKDGGIIKSAQNAKSSYTDAQVKEKIDLVQNEYKLQSINGKADIIEIAKKYFDKKDLLEENGSIYILSSTGNKYLLGSSLLEMSESDASELFSYTINNGECTITKLKDRTVTSLEIPGKIGGNIVTVFSLYDESLTALWNDKRIAKCESLSQITLPITLKKINQQALYGCISLTEVTIPTGVTTICNSAFRYCTSLNKITIPNSVTIIEDSVFEGCTSLKEITLPGSLTTIAANSAFTNSGVESLVIPNSVTSLSSNELNQSLFNSCPNLKSVVLPNNNSITTLGYGCFANCDNLTSITIPNNVTKINNYTPSHSPYAKSLEIKIDNSEGAITGLNSYTETDTGTAWTPTASGITVEWLR